MSKSAVPGLRLRERSPFSSLLSMQMKLAYGSRGVAQNLGMGRKSRFAYLYLVLLVVAFLPMASLLYNMAELMAIQSVSIGQPGLPVISAVTAGQFLVFFIGVSSLMSVLYYSNDMETLLGLPLTARQIMVSKLTVAYVTDVVICAVTSGPFLLALGPKVPAPEYWPYAVLVMAAIPAIPLTLSLLATVLIMRATKGSRKRDQFRVVFGLLFFAIILAVQFFNSSMATKGPDEMMRMLLERNGLIQAAAGYYPPLKWAAWALTADTAIARFGGLALFCGVSFGLLAAVTVAVQGVFLGGYSSDVATSTGSYGTRKRRTGAAAAGLSSIMRVRRPALAVALRDHYMLVRTPNFLLVTLTNLLVFPLVTIFAAVGSQGQIPYITGGATGPILDLMTLILVGVHGLIVAMNQVSSTAITREGSSFWASKMIPVAPKEQVRGKVYYGLMLALLQLLIFLVSAFILMKIDVAHLGVLAVLGILASIPVTCICIMNDLVMPKLKWDDPHQAMKGNFGALVAMLFSGLFLSAVGFVVKLVLDTGMSITTVYGIAGTILLVSGIGLWRAVEALAEKRYLEIEV